MNAGRIDVHQHLIPPVYLEALARHRPGGDWSPRPWSAAGAAAMMDRHEIATGLLSLSAPGCHLGDDGHARQLARAVNETQAELVKDHPDRFGMLAAVPLPDVDGALDTIAHAYDELRTDGVVLLANAGGTYLGDASFDPVLAELDRRSAVVFIHPTALPGEPARGIHPAVSDFLLDTVRAAWNLVLNGVPRRFPRLKMILAHGGGFLPYAAHRAATIGSLTGAGREPAELLEDLSSFYFDTALASSPSSLPSLLAFARPGHVLFGSDWPYAPVETISYFTDSWNAHPGLDPSQRQAIDRGNAEALLPRLA